MRDPPPSYRTAEYLYISSTCAYSVRLAWGLRKLTCRQDGERESFKGSALNDDQSAWVDADLVRAILDHLASHPHAADSAVGVARWWLGLHGAAVALPDAELALRQLVDRQQLRQESLSD